MNFFVLLGYFIKVLENSGDFTKKHSGLGLHFVWAVFREIQLNLIILDTDISKYTLISQNFLFFYTFQLLLSQTTGISK